MTYYHVRLTLITLSDEIFKQNTLKYDILPQCPCYNWLFIMVWIIYRASNVSLLETGWLHNCAVYSRFRKMLWCYMYIFWYYGIISKYVIMVPSLLVFQRFHNFKYITGIIQCVYKSQINRVYNIIFLVGSAHHYKIQYKPTR